MIAESEQIPNLTAKIFKERVNNNVEAFLLFTKKLTFFTLEGVGEPPPASGKKI